MGRDCIFKGCPGCDWRCKCDQRCFKCNTGHRMSCMEGSWTNWNYDGPRQKFLCFNCKHVWKSNLTKDFFDEKSYDKLRHIYEGKKPTCNKCGQLGIKVGTTFVACHTDKGWKELEEKVKSGKVNLINEFTYCPMNNRLSWNDIYPPKKWNDTRKNISYEIRKQQNQPIIPRPDYKRKPAALNAMGEAFLPGL